MPNNERLPIIHPCQVCEYYERGEDIDFGEYASCSQETCIEYNKWKFKDSVASLVRKEVLEGIEKYSAVEQMAFRDGGKLLRTIPEDAFQSIKAKLEKEG